MENEIFKVSWREAKAEQLIQLADSIIKKHQDVGPNSPLKGSLVAEMSFKNNAIKEKHEEGSRYMKLALAAFRERDLLIGLSAPENEINLTTLKSLIHSVRQVLMEVYKDEEAGIKAWGFTISR